MRSIVVLGRLSLVRDSEANFALWASFSLDRVS